MKVRDITKGGYDAIRISDSSRSLLAKKFPPKYPDWIGHHVTVKFGVSKGAETEYDRTIPMQVIGYVDGDGIEALVVEVDGNTIRSDGKTYHITWSLDRSKGRKPVHSNVLIASAGFTKIEPIKITGVLQYLT